MKKIIPVVVACAAAISVSWGTFGHEHIDRAAVFALPGSLQTFFYNHIDYITQESTVPDLRKYTLNDKAENPRHFIDLENFGSYDSLPATFEEAKKKYDEVFLQHNGILPWYLGDLMEKLTKAFKGRKKTEILFIASDLGHYIGDANMPLHTSANYDGQQTGQKGIHALFESRMPEMFGAEYNYCVRPAKHLDNVHKAIGELIRGTHQLVDSLLATDAALRKKMNNTGIFKTDAEGKIAKNKYGQPVYSDAYTRVLHTALNGMVEKQIRRSVEFTADFWYTAWVDAGKPDLSTLDPDELTKANAKSLKKERKLWQKGKLFGVESEKEF